MQNKTNTKTIYKTTATGQIVFDKMQAIANIYEHNKHLGARY